MAELQGAVAIVTGANGGMGRAITAALAAAGARVAAWDLRDPPEAAAVRAAAGDAITHQVVDTADRAAVEAALAAVQARLSAPTILINAAAVLSLAPFLELTDEQWDRLHAIDLKGYFLCGQTVARAMVQAGRGGKIVNVSSNSQTVASPNATHYATAKGGVAMLTRNMALELAPHHINVNAVCPGVTLTDMNRERLADPAFRAARERTVPWGRLGTPEDIAAAVLFLVGPGSDYITGAALYVDGGQSLTVGG